MSLTLMKQPGEYFVQQLKDVSALASINWSTIDPNQFFSVTKTQDEISIICQIPLSIPTDPSTSNDSLSQPKVEGPWALYRVAGQLDFSLTGIMSQLVSPLAVAAISVFTLSTYDTDYILIKVDKSRDAEVVWQQAGFNLVL
jgi:hypothetical protein